MSTTEITPATATRTVDGVTLPTPGVWSIDASHTTAAFVARHLMVTKTRGTLAVTEGAVTVAEDPADSSVEVTLDAASIDSRDEARDGHLRSPDFLDVERYPTLTFRSTSVEADGADWKVTGDLTIKDVTRSVVLDVSFDGVAGDPWGGTRAAFSASTTIDREDFGLTWNVALEGGGVLVGKKVTIELDVQAVAG